METSRGVSFPGFTDSLSADYDARTTHAFGEVGYAIEASGMAIESFAGLAHVSMHTDGFAEDGVVAALSASSQTAETTSTTLGLQTARNFTIGGMAAT